MPTQPKSDAESTESTDAIRTLARRRDVFRTFGVTTTAVAGAAALAACGVGAPAASNAPASTGPAPSGTPESKSLRIGYLPITDATPLLVAHAQNLYGGRGWRRRSRRCTGAGRSWRRRSRRARWTWCTC
jgi:hypothetical protein